MILEGLVTTRNDDGSANLSPMGPRVDRDVTWLQLRPFQTSRTYHNLAARREGVFHVVDDVELLARCAIGQLTELPALTPSAVVAADVLTSACRWYAFRVTRVGAESQRATLDCQIVDVGRGRDFFGFNRAKHAVLEAAILATRVSLLDPADILRQYAELAVIVEKTAGDQEQRAFELLRAYLARVLPEAVTHLPGESPPLGG